MPINTLSKMTILSFVILFKKFLSSIKEMISFCLTNKKYSCVGAFIYFSFLNFFIELFNQFYKDVLFIKLCTLHIKAITLCNMLQIGSLFLFHISFSNPIFL